MGIAFFLGVSHGCRHFLVREFVTIGILRFPYRIVIVVPCRYPPTRTNLQIRIAIDVCQVAAAVDMADEANGKLGIAIVQNACYFIFIFTIPIVSCAFPNSVVHSRRSLVAIDIFTSHYTILHVHIDVGTANHVSLIATAKDGANLSGRNDIDTGVMLGIAIEVVGQQGFLDRIFICLINARQGCFHG